ncbi:MAG: hypothetical protein IT205_06505 [Fimbriimonadaceae bacterium]|nr:hypothetical protein [Fimbriimonadaceae bacterium]
MAERERWKAMVLRSMLRPAWLNANAPENDVAISSRCRYARNLRGHHFPNHASSAELKTIAARVKEAGASLGLETFRRLGDTEREYMVGCRLMSTEFAPHEPGRLLLIDKSRAISIMVNEEDHLRIQSLHAGWSVGTAASQAQHILKALDGLLEFATATPWGYLAASPFNAGEGVRLSAMFHLAGLAHTKRLNEVLAALSESQLTARGLFGESSRAVGAFFQVSMIRSDLPRFAGACEYVMREERLARGTVSRDQLHSIVQDAIRYAVVSKSLSQVDALRVLAWARWGIAAGLVSVPLREVDEMLSTLELRNNPDEGAAAKDRAVALRARFEQVLAQL